MIGYHHVLFATDLSERAPEVARDAADLARRYDAKFSLVHVIEEVSISAGYELMPLLPELPDDTLVREARESLGRLADQIGQPDAQRWAVTAPSTKEGIIKIAAEQDIDLIIVGSRGRHGLALLLGSTANAILHGAPCDVLAVRLSDR